MEDLNTLLETAKAAVQKAENEADLESIRINYLGKKGQLTELLKSIAQLPVGERPKAGQLVNEAKRDLSAFIDEHATTIQETALKAQLATEWCDVTLSGRKQSRGSLHPVTQIKQKAVTFFSELGFDVVTGPQVETEYYNFEALNIPKHHPARAMHDTFYFGDGQLLRTHTSTMQIRMMEQGKPPFRLIAPGRVYRNESDLTHTPMFHQLEGLFIDEQVTFAQLRGTLEDFLTAIFEKKMQVRFRPSYFPFTEPSAEVDMQCSGCNGKGCRLCSFTGWLEIGGCGMVHPAVLKAVNISPEKFQGWAFGLGMDRLAMIYAGIDDLRAMFENDVSFLSQFG